MASVEQFEEEPQLISAKQQKIVWQNNGDLLSSSIYSSNVTIISSSHDQSALGSSAVVVKSITDYPFMMPSPQGNGMAVHCSRQYLAYAINKVSHSSDKSVGMVRVMNTDSGQRCLIKDLRGLVMDLSFAWLHDTALLAFTDTSGALYIYQIFSHESDKPLSTQLILEVENDTKSNLLAELLSTAAVGSGTSPQHRVAWCRYLPESSREQQQLAALVPPHLLAVTLGSVVEVWQVQQLVRKPGVRLRRSTGHSSLLHTYRFTSLVTAATLSPDSTCIAIATADGYVRFYQVESSSKSSDSDSDEEEEADGESSPGDESDIMHEWLPHAGQLLSCLAFLDNLNAAPADGSEPSEVWKYAMTGIRNNSELRIWTCKTWTCLQVIRFEFPSCGPSPSSEPSSGAHQQQPPSVSAPSSASHSPALRCASLSPSVLQHNAASSSAASTGPSPGLLVYIDDSANYMMLTDQARKMLYICMLSQVANNGKTKASQAPERNGCATTDGKDVEEGDMPSEEEPFVKRVVSITEIPVQFVPLCVAITSANMKPYQRWKHDMALQDCDGPSSMGGSEGTVVRGLVLHCHILTTKSLHQCSVRFQPSLPSAADQSLQSSVASPPTKANGAEATTVYSEDLLDVTLSSTKDLHDGLTDLDLSSSLSMSESELNHSAACLLPITSSANSCSGPAPSTASLQEATPTPFPLSALLPPHLFMASATLPSLVKPSLPVDPSLNNKANATLAALLMCPDSKQASAIIAGGQSAVPPRIPTPLQQEPLNGTVAVSEDTPSSVAASMLGLLRDRASSAAPSRQAPLATSEPCPRSSSVPLATTTTAAACSSTSSPSLEIQQILQYHAHDKSSGGSSVSSSRGPTQLEMAEEDSHLAPSPSESQQQQSQQTEAAALQLEEDQPEALRQHPAQLDFSSNLVSAANGSASLRINPQQPHGPHLPIDSSSTEVVSEEEKQRIAVQVIHNKLLEEGRIRMRHREQEQIRQQQEQLHKRVKEKKSKAAAAANGVSSSVASSCSVPAQSPDTTNFLQSLLCSDGATASSAPPPLGDIFGARDSLTQFTCEQLEAQIKGGSGESATSSSSTTDVSAANNNVSSSMLNFDRSFVSNGASGGIKGYSTTSVTSSRMTNEHSLFGGMSLRSETDSVVGNLSVGMGGLHVSSSDRVLPVYSDVSNRLAPTQMPELADRRQRHPFSSVSSSGQVISSSSAAHSSAIGGSSIMSTSGAAQSDDASSSASDALLEAFGPRPQQQQSIATNTDAITLSSVGVQQRVDTSNIAVQASAPPPAPATVLCQHSTVSHSAELKELRSLLITTQQQINKLNKKVDEMASTQKSYSPQAVAAALRPGLENAARTEIRQTLPHTVTKGLESAVGQQLPHDLQRMMAATEVKLTENITKMIHSRAFNESVTQAVVSAISPSVTAACRDAYTKLVLPGFNTLTTRILQQFNELFHKGTAEYLLQVKNEVSGVVSCVDGSVGKVVRDLDTSRGSFTVLLKAHQDLLHQHQQAMQQYASHVVTENVVRRIVADEVGRVAAVLQRAAPPGTPAPGYYPATDKPQSPKQAQLQLEQLIAAKQFNTAFKQALSASDLSQVLFVCERVNRESLMVSGNCKLSQEVLMSLINQLSHDLTQKTDLKMKFLEDALLCIETSHPVTREHIRTVAVSLQRNLQAHLDSGPPAQTQNRFRMMLLAAKQLASPPGQ